MFSLLIGPSDGWGPGLMVSGGGFSGDASLFKMLDSGESVFSK